MLRETIFAATQKIRDQAGPADWCVSVFRDNAGVVRFDDQYNLVFKVETHNHPSALEPYGGANTGLGGVIRDPMGTGMGARPVCNTDVFCFAPPDLPAEEVPPGVLHPRRVIKGVVSGRPRLRQPHGHSHRQRGRLLRSPLPGQPAGLLRQHRPDPRRQVVQAAAARRPDRGRRRTDRPRRHPRRHLQLRRADQPERDRLRRRRADRQRHHRKDAPGRAPGRPRPRPLRRRDRLRRRRVFQRRGRDGREDRRRGLAGSRAAEVRGPLLHGNLDLRGPGADGAGRAAGEMGRAGGPLRLGGRRGHGDRPLRAHRPAAAEIQRPAGGRPGDGVPPRRPPAGGPRRRLRAAAAGRRRSARNGPAAITPTSCCGSSAR